MHTRALLFCFLFSSIVPTASPASQARIGRVTPVVVDKPVRPIQRPIVPSVLPSSSISRSSGRTIVPANRVIPGLQPNRVVNGRGVVRNPVKTVRPTILTVMPDSTERVRIGPGRERMRANQRGGVSNREAARYTYTYPGYPGKGVNRYASTERSLLTTPFDGPVPGLGAVAAGVRDAGLTSSIQVGTQRADVIRSLGPPSARVSRPSGRETLIFSDRTLILQNGVVAVVQ